MERGAYSDSDALQLLLKKAADSFTALKLRARTPSRDRLLLGLAPEMENPGLIQPGGWVHGEAGWGRIERIEHSGREVAFCFSGDGVLLHVLLRAGHEGEPVEIDTAQQTIRFTRTQQVYHCTKDGCMGFRSYSERLLIREHNRAAHMGIGPSFVGKPASSSYRRQLYFSQQPPENQYQ